MTAVLEEDVRARQASADGSAILLDDLDQTDLAPTSAPAVTRVPLHGPVDSHDVMCAKVIFALCGSVFPHPLLLAQQILGVEDQDFPEFQLNVAEAGNNCIDIVAAYLTNLRVMQTEEEPNPPVSLAMIQPRHTATVASVAAKARDLLCELASARATVKPRKAPKNKAIESAARAAAAAAATTSSATSSGPHSTASTATTAASGVTCSSDATGASASVSGAGGAADADGDQLASEGGCVGLFVEDAAGCESNDDADSVSGHQDTSRPEGEAPPTAREEEERLLVALQGPAAAEETLKMARARPAGCKGGSTSGAEPRPGEACAAGNSGSAATTNGSSALHSGPGGNGGGSLAGSPRAPPPPPPPARTTSAMAQYAAAGGVGSGGPAFSRQSTDMPGGRAQRTSTGMGGSGGAAAAVSASNLQTALSCPVTGLPEMLGGGAGLNGNNNHNSSPPGSTIGHPVGGYQQGSHAGGQHGQRRGGPGGQPQGAGGMHPGGVGGPGQPGQGQQGGGMHGGMHGGRRGGGGMSSSASTRGSPTPPGGHGTVTVQQQLQQQQQQQLAVAQLLGLRNAYGAAANNASTAATYNNLMALQAGAYGAVNGLGAYGPGAAAGRLDLNSMAATTAALELAAAQQAAALNMQQFGGYGGPAGFGGQPGGLQNHLGSLAGQLGGAGSLGGLMHHQAQLQQQHSQQQQQQQAAAAAAALLQQSGGMMLADSMKGAGGAPDWSNILLQAQLAAGSLA